MIPGVSPTCNRRSAALVAAPGVEPVTVADVKSYIKLDGTDEDGLVASLIATARRMAEEYTRRSFITQTWALTQDSFSNLAETPSEGYLVAPTPQLIGGANAIHLPRGSVQAIVSVIRRLARSDAEAAYRMLCWDACRCDDLPGGVDLAVFDAAVNSHEETSALWLQQVAGVKPDGDVGPVTLARVAQLDRWQLVEDLLQRRWRAMRTMGAWSAAAAGCRAGRPRRPLPSPTSATRCGPGTRGRLTLTVLLALSCLSACATPTTGCGQFRPVLLDDAEKACLRDGGLRMIELNNEAWLDLNP